MPESAIFQDRSKLSPRYIPEELPHREGQIKQIFHTFAESYVNPERFPLTTMQIIGPAGIGKTSTVIKVSKLLEEEFAKNRLELRTAYVNLKLQGGNKYAIYKYLLERIASELPAQGLSAEEMLRHLLHYLRQNGRYAVVVLDEFDYLIKTNKDSSIIYDLTRLNEFEPGTSCNIKGIIFIARSSDFYARLDAAELSTLGRVSMQFQPYSAKQVSDILASRCSLAFNSRMIGSDIIDEVSKIITSSDIEGDVRYALDLLLYAGNLAESQGTGRVTMDQIRKIHGQLHPSITSEEIEQLSKNQLLSLVALVRALRSKKKQYVELKEVRAYISELSDELELKRIDIEDYLDDLQARKLVEIRSLKEIGLHGASLQELEPILLEQIGSRRKENKA